MTTATVAKKIIPTEEQRLAIDAAKTSVQSGTPLIRIGGYAGTGKSTIARFIVDDLDGVAGVCAFTGKAASVLRRKGLSGASTIHGLIYKWDDNREMFILNRGVGCTYFLLDEGSMVSRDLWRDLQSFGKPIIVIGDPGQLDPVGDDPRLMHDPDIILDQIHRQAEGNAIIEFANHVRHGKSFKHGTKNQVQVTHGGDFWDSLDWADQVLCGFNKTRVRANSMIREHRGYRGVLNEGERIIILKNNRELGVWNGQTMTVQAIKGEGPQGSIKAECLTDDGQTLTLPIYRGQFGSETKLKFEDAKRLMKLAVADYGYCTTVHKFQGSEADRVLVMDQQCNVWNSVRWRYTAITRAAEQLRYCID